MDRSPTETYRALVNLINDYDRFTQRIVHRLISNPNQLLRVYSPRGLRRLFRIARDLDLIFLFQSQEAIETLKQMLEPVMSSEEKEHRYYRIATSPYPSEALARHIKATLQLTSQEATELLALADQEKPRLQRIAPGLAAATIVTIAAVFVSQVPEQVFVIIDRNVGWLSWLTYARYQLVVFLALLVALFFFVLPSLVLLPKRNRSDKQLRTSQNILTYCTVLP